MTVEMMMIDHLFYFYGLVVAITCFACFMVYTYLYSHRRKGGLLIGLLGGTMFVDSILLFISLCHLVFSESFDYRRMAYKLLTLIMLGALVKIGLIFYIYKNFIYLENIASQESEPGDSRLGTLLRILGIYKKSLVGLFHPGAFLKHAFKLEAPKNDDGQPEKDGRL
jgi:uncharacterized membrane-anchored protein